MKPNFTFIKNLVLVVGNFNPGYFLVRAFLNPQSSYQLSFPAMLVNAQ
jgi:hypothetical protein